jgi:hypothetical protein
MIWYSVLSKLLFFRITTYTFNCRNINLNGPYITKINHEIFAALNLKTEEEASQIDASLVGKKKHHVHIEVNGSFCAGILVEKSYVLSAYSCFARYTLLKINVLCLFNNPVTSTEGKSTTWFLEPKGCYRPSKMQRLLFWMIAR